MRKAENGIMGSMNIIRIDDINAPELDIFARTTENQLRSLSDVFIAESAYVIIKALEAGYEPLSILVESDRVEIEAGPVFEAV